MFSFVAMANDVKPCCLLSCDGTRYETHAFSRAAMADVIKPMFVFVYCDGKHYKTNDLLLYIAMTDVIKPMFDLLFRWATLYNHCVVIDCDGKRYKTHALYAFL